MTSVSLRFARAFLLCSFFAPVIASAVPKITEIYYHHPDVGNLENPAAEWLEITEVGNGTDLSGWRLSAGVDFTFPAGTTLASGERLVVAADPVTFAANAQVGAPVALGPWDGRLSNSGETIRLRDENGTERDQVDYADEGDWATRARGPLDLGHRGWIWEAPHDGGGFSLERINMDYSSNNGQNWATSIVVGGSPGALNSVDSDDTAPLFLEFGHAPLVPSSVEPVTVSVRVNRDVNFGVVNATLFWRLDGVAGFTSIQMTSESGDYHRAMIPAQADGSIIEFYVDVTEGGNTRSWPAEVAGGGHLANALYQVDDSFDAEALCAPGTQPTYYVIMTESERAELEEIGTTNSQSDSNAEMNATFISLESSSIRVRYLASIRNRGASSRNGPPNNHLVKFRSDDAWEGLRSIKFNAQYTHSQVAGSWLYQWLGIEAADSIGVQLRINGSDLAEPGGPRMYGSYARTESLDADLVAAHWPNDSNGNLYQVRDDEQTGDEGDLKYEGTNPLDYQNTYFKQTNGNDDDWSDIIALTDALNNSPQASYLADVSAVLDVDQWLHFLAVDSLIGNREGGLTTGKGDDFALYRGTEDPRFLLVPHDLDTVLDQGTRSGNPNLSLFTYEGVDGLDEFLNHPDIVPLYYAKYLELIESRFRSELIHPIIDRAVGSWASAAVVQEMKDFVTDRRAGVLALIPQTYSATTDLPSSVEGYARTTDGSVTFSGSFHAAYTRSVLVNGQAATLNARAGTWELAVPSGGGAVLKPGLNRVRVAFHADRNGMGELLNDEFLYVWNDTGSTTQVSGTLTGASSLATMNILTRDTYQPGVPFLVRVDFRNPDGSYARDVWETTAALTTDVPGVLLTPNTVDIRNGLGTALVSAGGGAGGTPVTVLAEGITWKYLDDGSDQGTAWRGVGFNDSAWDSGPAQLGYGDGDEDTEVSFGPNQFNKHATTYFRSTFNVADAAVVTAVDLRLQYDDGAAVYVNGTELFRSSNMDANMPFDEYSEGDTNSEDFQNFNGLSPALLVTGTNTIAVEIKQGDGQSSDISFDLELITQTAGAGTDPGDFTLTAAANGQTQSKALVSLTPTPATASVSGVLPGANTFWSGVIRVTDDVTVPVGHVLNITPGTLILIDGDATPESTAGKDIIVQGTINSAGTELQPVTFTATDPAASWGQILFDEAEGASFAFTNIHRAGHSPRGGHTGHGRVLRILGSDVLFEDCSITDNIGKIGETAAAGGTDSQMTFRRCHWARSVMGIETFDTGVLVEDCFITDMLGIYREDGITDDDDAIYLHGAGAGQQIILRRLTVAYVDDDGIDTLGADVTIEDAISRNCADKGASIFNDNVTINRGLFVGNDIGISAKDGANVTLDHVTVADNTAIGVQAENKDGNDAASFYQITNSIVWGSGDEIATDYVDSDITVTYSNVGESWVGIGNLNVDPQFVAAGAGDYHLSPASPLIAAGDPAAADQDMGYYPFVSGGTEVRWSAASGPYHVTADATVPAGLDFIIEPGTSIYFDPGTRLTVEGKARIVGTPEMRIQMSHLPGSALVADPAGNGGLPDAPPKWEGLKIVDSMDPGNLIAHVDVGSAQDSNGSIGIIRSQCVVDDVTFRDTHIRMFYTDDASIILRNSIFPDMFEPGQQAAALGLDNISEHVKGVGDIPADGRYIILNNFFGINKGHNDVVDVESGRRPDPIVQIIGNRFAGAGDELLDLGGDVYIADNVFFNVFKDDETSDRGYANAISTGDGGTGTTISVARNIFWDVDHAINLKVDTSTIFEHNSIYKIHPDFNDGFGNPSVASVVNLFIPTDTDPSATAGDGAYLYGNILADVPRVFSGADDNKTPPFPTSPLEMFDNLIDPNLIDATIGQNHPGQTVFDLGTNNRSLQPLYADPDNGDFSLLPGSPAIGAGAFGEDLGALIAQGILISGEPPAVTSSGDATLTVGGPGIFAYRWRLNSGPWSGEFPIGNGFDPPNATVRSADLVLTGLADGDYTVQVEGQTFAGEWQATPTVSKTWTVSASIPASLRLDEIVADQDFIELHNPGTAGLTTMGFTISDDPTDPARFAIPDGAFIAAGDYIIFDRDSLGFGIDMDGETITLYQNGVVVDSVTFGPQIEGLSIGRVGRHAEWALTTPTNRAPNVAVTTGNSANVRINEWLVNGQVSFGNEFVELANPDPLPVDISGMSLTDNPNFDQSAMVMPPLSFIAGAGFLAIEPDGFKLSAEIDQIGLFDAAGTLQDSVVYGPQTEDYSQGIAADGVSYQQVSLPTPGLGTPAPGSPEEAAFLSASAVFESLRITELMYHAPAESGFDYVELRNIGASAIDLTGVRFTNGIDFVFPSMTLAPGAEVLVVSNMADFEARYGSGLNVAGEYDGNFNNFGEGVTLALAEPYQAAMLRFDYNDGWYRPTDGDGPSLEIVDPALKPSGWSSASAWQQGAHLGSPDGRVIAEDCATWLAATGAGAEQDDPDCDGLVNLVEYALGTDPLQPNGLPRPIRAGNTMEWAVVLPITRPDVSVAFERSDDLLTWAPLSNNASFSSVAALTSTVTAVVATAPESFLRLKVTKN